MKYIRIALLVCGTLLIAAPSLVSAQTILNADRLSAIQQRCSVLQTTLDVLQRRDLVARTDHGREYENIIKQVDAFAQRLQHNGLSTLTLDASTLEFKTSVGSFRQVYIRYDDSMNALLDIDCTNRTADFAQALELSRVLRAEVGAEVTKAETSLLNYRKALVALQTTLPADTQGGAQ